MKNIPATAECYDQFVNALRKVARKNIPRGCRRNYVPGLTPESIELIEEYREKYEDDPSADNTITRGEELMSAVSQDRSKAWQTLIESTDMSHNSKKAYSKIRKLCDFPCKPKQNCNTTANQVTHRLQLNGRLPNRQPKVRLDRHTGAARIFVWGAPGRRDPACISRAHVRSCRGQLEICEHSSSQQSYVWSPRAEK